MQTRMARMVKMATPRPIPSLVLKFLEALEGGAVAAIVVAELEVLLVCAGTTEGVGVVELFGCKGDVEGVEMVPLCEFGMDSESGVGAFELGQVLAG